MTTDSGSSSSSSSSSSSRNRDRYNPDTNSWERPGPNGSFSNVPNTVVTDRGNTIALPTARSAAPRGAYLGESIATGGSIVSEGDGKVRDTATGLVTRDPPTQAPPTTSAPRPAAAPPAQSISPPSGGGGGRVGTSVNAPPGPGGSTPTPVGNRTDFSPVLAGQSQRRPDRSPSRSNNFVSFVGGAGGLGRRSDSSKRTLIGGA